MAEFLLEILSEEIPAKMQKAAVENLSKIALDVFAKNDISCDKSQLKTYITPRRLVLEIADLEENQKIPAIKRVGPKISANKKAIEGFIRSVGLKDVSELKQVEHKGSTCYLHEIKASKIKTSKVLQEVVPNILQKMTNAWPKLMRWDIEGIKKQPKWVRPIRNILCIFDAKALDFEFAGLMPNNLTYGHYSSKKKIAAFEVESIESYKKFLQKNYVILDQEERRSKIISQILEIKNKHKVETIDPENSSLVDEVTGLCEWPTALLANICDKFMHLPEEILVLTLRSNQRYFCLRSASGKLAPQFIFITDCVINKDNESKIIADNEKLVSARLSDAQFFIEEDLATPLESRLQDLNQVILHNKLGSVYDKTERIKVLTKFLAIFVPHCDITKIDESVDLLKNDLLTKAVGELPELQGKIGAYYAKKQGKEDDIVSAIQEHYLPVGPNSELPQTSLGIALSIADKMDNIVGFFLADEKPTSSKDPFALRRAALGVIRIGFEHNIVFPIRNLVQKSLNAYPIKLTKSLLLDDEHKKLFDAKRELEEEVVKFFVERLKFYLKETKGMKPDITNVVIDAYLSNLEIHKNCNILYLANKIQFLDAFIKDEKNSNIIELYKRSANILAIEEKKDKKTYNGKHPIIKLQTKYEIVLYRRVKQIRAEFKKLITKGEFEEAFNLLKVLEMPMSHFFDNVVVNCEEKNIREDRLQILGKVRALFDMVADLSKVEIN